MIFQPGGWKKAHLSTIQAYFCPRADNEIGFFHLGAKKRHFKLSWRQNLLSRSHRQEKFEKLGQKVILQFDAFNRVDLNDKIEIFILFQPIRYTSYEKRNNHFSRNVHELEQNFMTFKKKRKEKKKIGNYKSREL